MKFKGATSAKFAVCAALCAAFGAAQAATADQCRQAVGFPVFSGEGGSGAWARVTENTRAFLLGRHPVTSCVVEYPLGEGKGKGKPDTAYFSVLVDGAMAKEQCNAYGELAMIDSKLSLIKFQDALDKASALSAKLATLRDAGKLTTDGYEAIVTGQYGVDAMVGCLTELVTQ